MILAMIPVSILVAFWRLAIKGLGFLPDQGF